MRTLALVAVASLLLPGCRLWGRAEDRLDPPKEIRLGSDFAPLVRVREEKNLPGLRRGMVATVGTEVLTLDMRALLAAYPEGSTPWRALMHHEQEHARGQAAQPLFFYWYATQPHGFRWAEEKRGWRVELRYLREHGWRPDFDSWAKSLANDYGGMATYLEAMDWLRQEWSAP